MKSVGYFHDSAILNRDKSHQGPLNRGLEDAHSRMKRFLEQINSIVPANEAQCSIPQPSRYNESLISAPKH
jgi:hypothetical protein